MKKLFYSTTQQLNNSTTQQLNNSTTQQLNNSTTQQLNNSTTSLHRIHKVSFCTIEDNHASGQNDAHKNKTVQQVVPGKNT